MRNAILTKEVRESTREVTSGRPGQDPARPAGGRWVFALYAAIFCGAAVLVYHNVVNGVVRPILESTGPRSQLLVYPSILWVVMGALLFGFRTCIWMRYRPFPPVSRRRAPVLTVVVPAYNEGAMVLQCIESVVKADYPHDRLQIVVIDDGSVDDTWSYISGAAARYPGLVTAVRQARNHGKREALAVGFARARGSIIVTLDSDSVVHPDALRALAGPFRDDRIGAVAGKVLVYNRRAGLIPRMLHVRFVLSFDLLRCVESAYGNVFCCPGALTAYRASAIRQVLDRWKSQTFLGAPCTFGEDRALTNFLLEEGFDTVYQRSAVVHTVVPVAYGKLCRMFIRWDRSYVREEIRFARIVWKRPMPTRLIVYRNCNRRPSSARMNPAAFAKPASASASCCPSTPVVTNTRAMRRSSVTSTSVTVTDVTRGSFVFRMIMSATSIRI